MSLLVALALVTPLFGVGPPVDWELRYMSAAQPTGAQYRAGCFTGIADGGGLVLWGGDCYMDGAGARTDWLPRGVLALWPAEEHMAVACIVERESGWHPWAVSPTDDRGLFQINARYHAARFGARWALRYDAMENARMARELWGERGWHPWVAARSQHCGLLP